MVGASLGPRRSPRVGTCALAKESPIDEFHRAAISAFKNLAAEAVDEAAKSLRTVAITADGVDLDAEGMGRPSST